MRVRIAPNGPIFPTLQGWVGSGEPSDADMKRPFDARVRLLRAFDSAEARHAMSEAVLGRVEWRRGELNPRPEITRMAASTRLVVFLISARAAASDSLRWGPAV